MNKSHLLALFLTFTSSLSAQSPTDAFGIYQVFYDEERRLEEAVTPPPSLESGALTQAEFEQTRSEALDRGRAWHAQELTRLRSRTLQTAGKGRPPGVHRFGTQAFDMKPGSDDQRVQILERDLATLNSIQLVEGRLQHTSGDSTPSRAGEGRRPPGTAALGLLPGGSPGELSEWRADRSNTPNRMTVLHYIHGIILGEPIGPFSATQDPSTVEFTHKQRLAHRQVVESRREEAKRPQFTLLTVFGYNDNVARLGPGDVLPANLDGRSDMFDLTQGVLEKNLFPGSQGDVELTLSSTKVSYFTEESFDRWSHSLAASASVLLDEEGPGAEPVPGRSWDRHGRSFELTGTTRVTEIGTGITAASATGAGLEYGHPLWDRSRVVFSYGIEDTDFKAAVANPGRDPDQTAQDFGITVNVSLSTRQHARENAVVEIRERRDRTDGRFLDSNSTIFELAYSRHLGDGAVSIGTSLSHREFIDASQVPAVGGRRSDKIKNLSLGYAQVINSGGWEVSMKYSYEDFDSNVSAFDYVLEVGELGFKRRF